MTVSIEPHTPQAAPKQTPKHPDPEIYTSLTRSLDFANDAEEKWWTRTAPLLSRILSSADYTLPQQCQFLTLYNTLMIPNFGPHPHTWHSSITHSGLPVEFSVNYQPGKQPTVRIGFEPASSISGGARDPYNMVTVSNVLNKMGRLGFAGFDPSLFHTLISTLALSRKESNHLGGAKLEGSKFKTQAAFGLDLKGDAVTVKTYLYPALKCKVGDTGLSELLEKAITKGQNVPDCGRVVSLVNEYMEEGQCYNQYSFVGFDCVDSAKARLKVYGALLDISWAKVEEIWTLGGRLADSETNKKGLEYMRVLWEYLTPGQDRRPVGIWNYELLPNSDEPMPKFYVDMNGENDLQNAQGIAKFMQHIGLTATGEEFIKTIQEYFPGVDLEQTTDIIQYVSFAWSKGGPYFSVYYHSSY
ncbi:putative DMATS type aromatic prenyltransferase [Aspergillus brunneoviolaceus CBS 621.78]|uniref:DMATS type aromatic prenyltransferase n=1 Tax=Aspergillus brunneoviolaceus CBS 621.78 TaxID=1450534 RepID=A0ACD1GPR3_9EURO|nr:putative DMATS type aromatic prenyltransferase [Aspergillus brunneoviolaceus CBS 621.78]RAH51233.1 putative DMATS type aromatic prenyltransferase [Aspergillus brunneoviolaceus CBS 621.78]